MKAVVTSDATKMTVLAFMHVKDKVLEVADWKYNVKFNLWRYFGHHSLRGHPNGYLRVRVLWVADFKYDVKYALRYHYISTVARESEGPLPSCYQITRISFLPLFTVMYFLQPSLPLCSPQPGGGVSLLNGMLDWRFGASTLTDWRRAQRKQFLRKTLSCIHYEFLSCNLSSVKWNPTNVSPMNFYVPRVTCNGRPSAQSPAFWRQTSNKSPKRPSGMCDACAVSLALKCPSLPHSWKLRNFGDSDHNFFLAERALGKLTQPSR